MANITIETQRSETGRLLRFMAVGLSGTMVDFTLLTLLKEAFLLPTLVANTLSFSAGLTNNFTWNRLWTFADARSDNIIQQFLQFATVSIIGLVLNNLIVLSLEAPLDTLLGTAGYGYLPAKVCAAGFVFLWNFTANRYWTFNSINRSVS
ncbi:MAG: GtrA family protein [Chloroflexi bacterium]|nr:GtrA family protein [Chloroflexota bacterium]